MRNLNFRFDLFEGDQLAGSSALVDSELLRHISLRREADRLADWQPRGRGDQLPLGRLFGIGRWRRMN